MIRLELLGNHTQLGSTLCAECPQGTTGCCVSPPEYDWSDLGRVVVLGGRGFILEQIAAGRLLPSARGLEIRRTRRRDSLTEPRRNKCAYHGPRGCTLATSRRPATCNYFLCEDAYLDGGEPRREPVALEARETHGALRQRYEGWDQQLSLQIASSFPEGVPWDAAFLDWLGAEFSRLSGG